MNRLFVLILITVFPAAGFAQEKFTAASGPEQAALVELYTSEGCSSCPPADRWFSSLKDETGLWKEFVPAGFHVHYWDDLGWKDRLASPAYTARQRAYAASWGSGTIYTPGVVLAGKEWRGWRGGAPVSSGETAGLLRVSGSGQSFDVEYVPPAGKEGPFRLYGALLGFGVTSDVRAGENRGQVLTHDFAVLSLEETGLEESGGTWRGRLTLEDGEAEKGSRRGAAFWVSGEGSPVPLQAAGGFLS